MYLNIMKLNVLKSTPFPIERRIYLFPEITKCIKDFDDDEWANKVRPLYLQHLFE